ncbi:sigma-70 family RNA polymerase sigma factor [Frankia sp. R82]|uniref:sigma-70 family RNA polymerase sigma factor n=1 Tax=Frankia sp. R82 TaxID=2950553 RepID=UPI002043F67D|nr:sigma-70 family RNA polymerase sigma factor [Frankia sp. R82]MCM3884411.1 sigma-70 family RNA polymerase sigma factor [Frankia sp. R82]
MADPLTASETPSGERAVAIVRALFDECAADLHRYARRIGPDDAGRAEDLVQETFLRAWRHREELAAHGNARAWLFRVARNLSVDWHRRQAARPSEQRLAPGDDALLADSAVADALHAVLLRVELVQALRTLSDAHRETLVHLHCLDRTQLETAGLLGVPLGTVKSRRHVAVREMRGQLVQRGLGGIDGS